MSEEKLVSESEESAELASAEQNADAAGAAGAAGTGVEALEEALAAANAKAEEHWNQLLRARAELENLRKRTARDVENAHKYSLERHINELLPVKDSMELGLDAAQAETGFPGLRDGIELTLKMFNAALEKAGVEEINPVGEKFDPEFHQAMTMEETSAQEPGTVVRVMQKGYVLNQRLIRPAMVIVAKAPPDTGG